MSNTPKIDEIAILLKQVYAGGFQDAVNSDHPYSEDEEMGMIPLPLGKAKEAIYQLILEVIGEDDTAFKLYGSLANQEDHEAVEARNNLRAEQRLNLNNLFGKDK